MVLTAQTGVTPAEAQHLSVPQIRPEPGPVELMPPSEPRVGDYPAGLAELPSLGPGCDGCSSPFSGTTLGAVGSGSCLPCSGRLCVPGQSSCSPCVGKTRIGRFLCGIYEALCCPDPCYEPEWIPLADASFFCEAARPVSRQCLRWDAGLSMVLPDRAEYFWARADGHGKGPSPVAPHLSERSLTYNEMSLYTETSSGKFALFVNQPYRSVVTQDGPDNAGFGALDMGTKTLIFDCQLLQISFLFRTYMPMGNPSQGLGNGHVSLEPSLIFGLYLSPKMYLQTQISEWIPIGGDSLYEGAILRYQLSVNRVLFQPLCDVPLIGTFEISTWSFQDGAYTDPVLGTRRASADTYVSMGPGLRLFVRDRIDFGVGAVLSLTEDHFAETLIRSEFRWRF